MMKNHEVIQSHTQMHKFMMREKMRMTWAVSCRSLMTKLRKKNAVPEMIISS